MQGEGRELVGKANDSVSLPLKAFFSLVRSLVFSIRVINRHCTAVLFMDCVNGRLNLGSALTNLLERRRIREKINHPAEVFEHKVVHILTIGELGSIIMADCHVTMWSYLYTLHVVLVSLC